MWLFVMFDLPTVTAGERKQAAAFRNSLLDLGFEMSQFSVYLKYCSSAEKAAAVQVKIKRLLPSGGKVDILMITDKQFGSIKRYHASHEQKKAQKPVQLHMF
ncbi:CRISPR-associated endonuclease Cas2 [Alphaproteobacteria bacterium]|nr:CRISPR-associated endonuclease Cas2 [Alphaproteobacteria bacterium]